MKFKIQDLLTLLIGLFLLGSCKDDSTIGLDLDPNTALEGKLIDTLTVRSQLMAEEAVQTGALVRYPLGYMNDPVFGKTEASLALTVNTPGDNFDFGTNPILDSAVLVLPYSTQFYGDTTTSSYSIDIRQLKNDISKDQSFLSSRTYPEESFLIANKTGKIYPKTKFKIVDVIKDRSDTLKAVAPQIRIKLDKGFITTNVLGQTKTLTVSQFLTYFRGLKVSINKTRSTGNLGFMFFNLASDQSSMELYYKRQNATNTALIDTVKTAFPIATDQSPVVASVTHDYAGTPIINQLSNTSVQYPVTYLQGLSGLRNRLSFPFLKTLRDKVGKVVINKAELVVDVSAGTNVAPYGAPYRLGLYRFDIANQRQDIPDRRTFQSRFQNLISGDVAFGGFFDSIKNHYVFVITSYVQNILDGKDEDYGTFLSVTPSTEFNYLSPSLGVADRTVIGSGSKNASGTLINPSNRIKLNIFYTKIN